MNFGPTSRLGDQKWPVAGAEELGYFFLMHVDVGGATAIGRRSENQDRWEVARDGRWALVSDGVGGAAGGRTAADLAIATAADALAADWPVEEVFARAHDAVLVRQRADVATRHMAATLTLARHVTGSQWLVAAAGDSPPFRVAGSTQKLLPPHTVASALVAAGAIAATEADHHPGRNSITRAIGHSTSAHPDSVVVEVPDGAALVLASDGIDVLGERQITGIVTGAASAGTAAASLVEAALTEGATDNVTVVVLRPSRAAP